MPHDPATTAERIRRRGTRIATAFVLLTLLLVAGGAYLLADSQAKDRQDLRDRYAIGAEVAADTLNGLFGSAIQQALPRYAELFGGRVTRAQLESFGKQQQSSFVMLLDDSGRVLARTKSAPDAPDPAMLRRLTPKSPFSIGDVLGTGAAAGLQSAIRFPTGPASSRTLVSGSYLKLFRGFLTGAVAKLVRYGGAAYVLDGNGMVLGAVSLKHPKQPPPPGAELVKLARSKDRGFYTVGGQEHFFASRPVASSRWHVAVSAATSDLYAPISGVSQWLPWVILGILGVAFLVIGLLVRRALEASARIAVVNAQLASSQERLRERAVELQRANAELQRSNADLEQFAYVASHDLSAPLRAVAGFSQLIAARYKGKLDGQADEFIGHMQEGVDRMQGIIDDLLSYSRVDRSDLDARRIDLDDVLDGVLHALGPEIAERQAEVTRDPLGQACGDPGQLSQVLQNLVSNGMKFTAPGVTPHVHVSATRSEGRVRVSVRDNGIGIDPEHAERIFKMFQRLHSADDYPGTGIGLAISEKIIERHDGKIIVEPAPGGGTVFTFDLPSELPGGATERSEVVR